MKSVLGCLPLYFFSLFRAPSLIIDLLKKLIRRFIWGGNNEKNKINWVVWKIILCDKEKRGLGFGSLYSLNWALLIKWIWRYQVDHNFLWRRVICGIHNLDRKPVKSMAKKSFPCVWYNISKVIQDL